MTTRTEYAISHSDFSRDDDSIVKVVRVPMNPTRREDAEDLRDHINFHATSGWLLPADAVVVTRTITEWAEEPPYEPGTPVIYTSPRTGKDESGWVYDGPDESLPTYIAAGLVKLKWVGSDRLMNAHGVNLANLRRDPNGQKV